MFGFLRVLVSNSIFTTPSCPSELPIKDPSEHSALLKLLPLKFERYGNWWNKFVALSSPIFALFYPDPAIDDEEEIN
jgi:hypothetical protein